MGFEGLVGIDISFIPPDGVTLGGTTQSFIASTLCEQQLDTSTLVDLEKDILSIVPNMDMPCGI
jgi:hypothetical protein